MRTQMCSNRAIVDSLECCMDDLVECFEDFVKKSLILIFLGIGVIVGLLCYLLKMVSERPPLNFQSSIIVPENTTHTRNEVNERINNNKLDQEVNERSNKLQENNDIETDKKDNNIVTLDKDIVNDNITTNNTYNTSAAMNTSNAPKSPNFNENVLREIALSCSKHACGGGSNTHIYIPSRVPVPSLQTSSSKHKLIPCLRKRSSNRSSVPSLQICPKITKPGSCCSMCCYDEPK